MLFGAAGGWGMIAHAFSPYSLMFGLVMIIAMFPVIFSFFNGILWPLIALANSTCTGYPLELDGWEVLLNIVLFALVGYGYASLMITPFNNTSAELLATGLSVWWFVYSSKAYDWMTFAPAKEKEPRKKEPTAISSAS